MDNMYYGYAVVEYERGWGSRPDGYVVTIDEKRKEFEKLSIIIQSYVIIMMEKFFLKLKL